MELPQKSTEGIEVSGVALETTRETRVLPRLPVQVVEHLHRLLGGDARLEDVVLDYVEFRWGKRDLFYIPPKAASEVIRRTADFLTAAKNHSEPELKF